MVDPTQQLRPEDKVIESFVGYLANRLYLGLQISDWPDKRSGSMGEIDAVAEGRRHGQTRCH